MLFLGGQFGGEFGITANYEKAWIPICTGRTEGEDV